MAVGESRSNSQPSFTRGMVGIFIAVLLYQYACGPGIILNTPEGEYRLVIPEQAEDVE